jgi:hypothetical protein
MWVKAFKIPSEALKWANWEEEAKVVFLQTPSESHIFFLQRNTCWVKAQEVFIDWQMSRCQSYCKVVCSKQISSAF